MNPLLAVVITGVAAFAVHILFVLAIRGKQYRAELDQSRARNGLPVRFLLSRWTLETPCLLKMATSTATRLE